MLNLTTLFYLHLLTFTSCVMSKILLSFNAPLIQCCIIKRPICPSTEDKGSSSKYISLSAYCALARLILCFWPPLKLQPLSPI